MKALISAELLRLRTVRSTLPSVLGALLFITATAIANTAPRPSHFQLISAARPCSSRSSSPAASRRSSATTTSAAP
jgi:hypothetical protein